MHRVDGAIDGMSDPAHPPATGTAQPSAPPLHGTGSDAGPEWPDSWTLPASADELPVIVWMHDQTGAQRFVNRRFEEFFGMAPGDADDWWQSVLHPDDADDYVREFDEAIVERRSFHREVRVRDATGTWHWIESWASPRFAPDGEYLGHIGASTDVSSRVRAETALIETAEFSHRVLDTLFASVGVLQPDGTLIEANRTPLEAAGITADDVLGLKFWDCYWWNYSPAVQDRLREAVAQAANGEVVRYDAAVRMAGGELRWLDFQLVPLRSRDGTVTHLVPSGLDISERRAAEAHREEMVRRERDARRRAEILEHHAARLAAAVTTDDIASVVLAHISEAMGFDLAAVNVVDGDRIRVHPSARVEQSDVHQIRWLSFHAELPGHFAIATNEPLRLRSPDEIASRFPDLVAGSRWGEARSLVALPLRSADYTPIGALVLGASENDSFPVGVLSTLRGVAEQAGLALERAHLHERILEAHRNQHEIAVRLQRALLPDRLVSDPRLPVGAVYRAASDQLEVGGDWYDSFAWPGGPIGFVVGDVVGHDVEAAAAMGRLRAATAALVPALPPRVGAMLGALEEAAYSNGVDFVTAACVIVDPASGEMQYATAGHPPPLLIDPDGVTHWLDDAVSAPIGRLRPRRRPEGRRQIEPGSTVVLYSDGLVETRTHSIDDGLEKLADAAGRRLCADTHGVIGDLVDDLVSELAADTADDVIVLAFRCDCRP
jgi:PAS domain S-box-containing protein